MYREIGRDDKGMNFVAATLYFGLGGQALKNGSFGQVYDTTNRFNFVDFITRLNDERADPTQELTIIADNAMSHYSPEVGRALLQNNMKIEFLANVSSELNSCERVFALLKRKLLKKRLLDPDMSERKLLKHWEEDIQKEADVITKAQSIKLFGSNLRDLELLNEYGMMFDYKYKTNQNVGWTQNMSNANPRLDYLKDESEE